LPALETARKDNGLPVTTAPGRIAAIDALRGAAIVAMASYHFAWDLFNAGLIDVDPGYDRGWRLYAHAIASTFLGLVGLGLVLASAKSFRWRAFGVRLARIVAAAAAVSLVTYGLSLALHDPGFFVYFGILHAIALSSVLVLPFLFLPSGFALAAAALAALAPLYCRAGFFDAPGWWWLGLSTVIQPTVDYVPVLPWIAAVLAGIAIGRLVLFERTGIAAAWQPRSALMKGLVLAGRWSLVIYLVHQPLLFGLAELLGQILAR
jgi:uncharacterized membrane protein